MQIEYFTQPPHPISITLIGVGGTGSVMLQQLGRINAALLALGHQGIHVTAFDGDTITQANEGRQLFSGCDIGQNKAVALVQNINRFFGTYWTACPYHFNDECHSSNIIISAVDNWQTRKEIDLWFKMIAFGGYSDRYRPYFWMDLGNGKDFGQMAIGGYHKVKDETIALPTIIDLYPDEQSDLNEPSCSLAEALLKQDLFINPFMATTAAEILYRFLQSGMLETVGFFLNLKTFKTNLISYEQRTNNRVINPAKAA